MSQGDEDTTKLSVNVRTDDLPSQRTKLSVNVRMAGLAPRIDILYSVGYGVCATDNTCVVNDRVMLKYILMYKC